MCPTQGIDTQGSAPQPAWYRMEWAPPSWWLLSLMPHLQGTSSICMATTLCNAWGQQGTIFVCNIWAQVIAPKRPELERGRNADLERARQIQCLLSHVSGVSSVSAAFLRMEQRRCCEPEAALLISSSQLELDGVLHQHWESTSTRLRREGNAGRGFLDHCPWFFCPSSAARNVSQPHWWQLHLP